MVRLARRREVDPVKLSVCPSRPVDEVRNVTAPTLITIGGSGVTVAAGLGPGAGATSPVELEAPLGVLARATPPVPAAASAKSAISDLLNVLGIICWVRAYGVS